MDGALADAEAVFFDIDNTLYDFEESVRAALAHVQRAFPDHVGPYPVDEVERRYYAANNTMTDAQKLALIERDPALYRTATWAAYLKARNLDPTPARELAAAFADWRLGNLHKSAYERALETVRECLKEGRITGIITNGPSTMQRGKLDALGLTGEVDEALVFVSGEFGHKKPAPQIFEAAVKAAGVAPDKCVMIGDSGECDIPARAIGMRAVLFNGKPDVDVVWDDWEHHPHLYCRSYHEFRRALGMR